MMGSVRIGSGFRLTRLIISACLYRTPSAPLADLCAVPGTASERVRFSSTPGSTPANRASPAFERCGAAGAYQRGVRGTSRSYGWPRIWRELVKRGIRVGKQRVQRLMQQHGIRARGKRRFRVTTTDRRHDLPIAPNLLNRNFTPAAPNQAWSGDITYIPTEEGWLFLAVVIDLFSRKVVGWSMRPDMHRSLVMDALEMGVFQRRPGKGELIFHSDRGSQYASDDFRSILEKHGHDGFDEPQGQLLGQRQRSFEYNC